MTQNKSKSTAAKWLLIVAAVVLLLFICYKAGWILTGDKNQVSEQEQREAIQQATEELNAEIQGEQPTLQEATEELNEAKEELNDAESELKEVHDAIRDAMK